MNPQFSTIAKDLTTRIGLILLVISFTLFALTIDVYQIDFEYFSGVFFYNYVIAIVYLIVIMGNNWKEYGKAIRFRNFTHNVLFLQLFNLSAYALNRTLPVFNISTNWLVVFLLLSNVVLVMHALMKDRSPTWFNYLTVVVCNAAILFHFYESLYIGQIYVIGIMAFWFFGIPLHAFVPIFFLVVNFIVVRRFLKKSSAFWAPTAVTWGLLLGMIGYVSVRFYQVNRVVNQTFHVNNQPYEEHSLPTWVDASKKLPKDWITKRALLSGLTYTNVDYMFRSFGMTRINERMKHDPLVVIASFFSQGVHLPVEDRLSILRYLFDARHQTERKFWSGDNLSTTDIVTNVQLFPEFRIAYTEKTFKIKNSKVLRRSNQQEALYTFYLPEGSAVTSAALWVNGKEEPAFLTTKSKADSAYQTIVGRERRDPLLSHWQEGNRVTVRVFPCTPTEDRQFKIGVTTPLQLLGDQLVYENIDFEGPYWKGAKESINVVTEGRLQNFKSPYSFKEEGTNYTYRGGYQSDWRLKFDAMPLSQEPFHFNGKSYNLKPNETQLGAFDAKVIYLDINRAWRKSELKALWAQVKEEEVYVYSNNRLVRVEEHNKKALFKQKRRQNFDLFPFHKIANPESALVISKFNQLTPTLSDLKNTIFLDQISTYFNESPEPIRLFNLGQELSPYLKTLKELRSIQLESGQVEDLIELLQKDQFYENQEDARTIVNQYGGFQLQVEPSEATAKTRAPDHLMRLFVYNDLLRETGKDFFNRKQLEDELIAAAQEAHVLTPVSSLIVLETQADYERFDIKKARKSLDNASISNSGAVPEPHEWLLIILVLAATVFFYYRK